MLIYATSGDLTAWDSTVALPGNADSLLRSASLLIASKISSAYYTADTTGLPTDPDLVSALRDATCAQVCTWIALKIDPAAGQAGVTTPATAKKVGTASLTYTPIAAQTAARMAAANTLCDEAVLLLQQANLLSSRIWTYG